MLWKFEFLPNLVHLISDNGWPKNFWKKRMGIFGNFLWLLLGESCAFLDVTVFGEGERGKCYYRLGSLTHTIKFLILL